MKTYAAIYNNNEIRENSSSGGIFSALADKFDVVYGVAMTEDCYGAEMIRVEGDISPLRGSKYFQAKVGDAFKLVKKDVEGNRPPKPRLAPHPPSMREYSQPEKTH
ncbi:MULTISPECIES: hypothetical protein [unclassified Blautia]|uniref:hypothetical protein n=1 Tax=unclassified Blautia TaxID=2648079 RepID=UPI003F8A1499